MKSCFTIGALMSVFAVTTIAHAQTGSMYTDQQLRSIKNRNSANAFTSQRFSNRVYSQAVPQYSFSNVNRGLFDSARSRAQKPFASLNNGPSVSPYLGLSSPFSSSASNYYTQVRPQLEQQRINQQLQQRSFAMQKQLNTVAAQPPYNPKGSENQAPTGHAAVFMNYGGYYPPVAAPKR